MNHSGRLPLPGTELAYETDGNGPAVILVHGFGLDTRMWDDQVAALCDVATVVRYDVRGFGRSSGPAPDVPYSHSSDLLALLDHLGIESALLDAVTTIHAVGATPQTAPPANAAIARCRGASTEAPTGR